MRIETGAGDAAPVQTAPGKGKVDPAKIHDAAQQFESLMIGQMLKSMREGGGSWLGSQDEDAAGTTAIEMAEEQFAKALSQGGGLGLARMVEAGLKHPTGSRAHGGRTQKLSE